MAEYRQWREQNRAQLHDVVPLDTPYNVEIEVSSLCNARCIYCAHSTDHGLYEGNMTEELFYKILCDLKAFPHKVKKCNLFGFGESLMHPKFPEMVKETKAADVAEAVEFTTNGMLLTTEKIDAILDAGIDTIRISLQGINEETYQKICGVHLDFHRFINNLTYLFQNRGGCRVRMKIADTAIKDIPDGEERFKKLFGPIADSIYIEHILPIYAGVDYDGIDKGICRDTRNGRMGIQQDAVHKVCHRPFYRLRICTDGRVTAMCCDATRDVLFGKIQDETLLDIWNGKRRTNFLKMQLEGKRFAHPWCKDCAMPNDIASEADILDPWAADILKRIQEFEKRGNDTELSPS